MGGGLQRFFRTRYHILPRVSIDVTTHVIKIFRVLYPLQSTTIISSLLHRLLYALLYNFSEISTQLNDLNALPRVTITFFKKEVY